MTDRSVQADKNFRRVRIFVTGFPTCSLFQYPRSGNGTPSLRQCFAIRHVGNADLLDEALHRLRPAVRPGSANRTIIAPSLRAVGGSCIAAIGGQGTRPGIIALVSGLPSISILWAEATRPFMSAVPSITTEARNMLKVPWHKPPLRRRCEILVPASVPPQEARAIRSENRALLISSIARGRRWLNELIADPTANAASIARRDDCSVRKVNMTISLAFLAPDLVKAAIEGRLPHGMGVVSFADLPAEWSRQHQMLGLPAQ